MVRDFNGLCKVHIHKDATANILSFSQLRQMGHSITYNEGERPDDDNFTITYPREELRFVHRTDGLYVHDTHKGHTCLITTVAENEARYTKSEVNQARDARQMPN
jgi:hypothetical protein